MAMADMKFLWCGVSYKEVLPQEKWGIVENFLQSYLKYTMLANEKGSKLNTGKFFREYRKGLILMATATKKRASVMHDSNYRKGITICKDMGCKRIVKGECYGWKDPLFMWEHYGHCPHFSNDRNLVEKIKSAIQEYEKKH